MDTLQKYDILITGTGKLAQELIEGLSLVKEIVLKVAVGGREISSASWICTVANSRAKTSETNVSFYPLQIPWEEENDLVEFLRRHPAKIIIHLASLQSPWNLNDGSEWSELVKKMGFGITVFRQSELLIRLVRAAKVAVPATCIINGCYPDACNQLLARLGLKVFTGIGNVSILESVFRAHFSLSSKDNIKIVAHHYHLAQLINGSRKCLPEVWINNEKVLCLNEKLSNLTLASDSSLNSVTAITIIPLIKAVLNNDEAYFNLPGPLGLPGGYPVKFSNGEFEISLPDEMNLTQALAFNKSMERQEGLEVRENGIYVDPLVISYFKKSQESYCIINEIQGYQIYESVLKN